MNITCKACEGTGEQKRNVSPRMDPQHDETQWCRGCGGTGAVEVWRREDPIIVRVAA